MILLRNGLKKGNVSLIDSSYWPALLAKNVHSKIPLAGNLFLKEIAGCQKHSDQLMLVGTAERLFFSPRN